PPIASTVVPASSATAPRFSAGSRTKTSVPGGASISSPATVNVAWPVSTRYSSSWPEGTSSCSEITAAPASPAVHALTPNACTSNCFRIGDHPSGRSRSAIVAVLCDFWATLLHRIEAVNQPPTWHHGLVAEWWAHFNTEGPEIEYFRARIADARPVLDAGCGTGRLLVPWLQAGIDVDGCDASADMVERCRRRAGEAGYEPTLWVQALHELDPPRRYRSVVVCGALGLGSTRAQDEEALRRL